MTTAVRHTSEEVEEACRRVAAGESSSVVAADLGVSRTTVYRWVNPEYAERHREAARAWKRRQQGTCERCGAKTKYSSHKGRRVSPFCASCAAQSAHKRGHGPRLRKILGVLATGDKSFSEISIMTGFSRSAMSNSLYQRLIPYGFVCRAGYGRYKITDEGLKRLKGER